MYKVFKIKNKDLIQINKDIKYCTELILKKKIKSLDSVFTHLSKQKKLSRPLFECLNVLPSLLKAQFDFKKYLPTILRKKALVWTYPQIRIDGNVNEKFLSPLHKDKWILNSNKKGIILWFPINENGASLYVSKNKVLKKLKSHSYWGIQSKDKIDLKKIKVNFGYGIIFDQDQIHKSVEYENRITIQLRYEFYNDKNYKKTINQVIDKNITNFWLKKFKLIKNKFN